MSRFMEILNSHDGEIPVEARRTVRRQADRDASAHDDPEFAAGDHTRQPGRATRSF